MLDIQHVTKVFFPGTVNEKVALEDINLHIDDGDVVCVIGSNGSGSEGSNQGSTTPPNNGGSTAGETAVYWAKTQLGKPYGHDNNGNNWDCNGLTHWAWAQAGYSIPAASGHYGYGQFQYMKNSGRWVTSVSQLKPGDLVFYSYDGGYTTYHVAMYIGGYQVIHSNGWGSGVVITGIYYDDGFCGGGTP